MKECKGCKTKCLRFEEPKCNKRDRSPSACNKCPNTAKCHLDKYFYSAVKADKEYRATLVEIREGINLTISEKKELASTLKPLLDKGQSIYQIKAAHHEIKQCETTLYNYIESSVFKDDGIDLFSLKEKLQRKVFKNKYKKRKEPVNYDSKKYKDYLEFKHLNPNIPTVQMDTVMNSLSGPYIQTFIFEKTSLMIGFIHQEKTSESMASTLDKLEEKMGYTSFRKMFPIILTDRGSEFEKTELFEFNTKNGESRLQIFYCDPMQSSQKPHVENNHNYVRDIIPNEIDLSNIIQEDLNLVFSHINSTPREIYGGKTPYEMFKFIYGEKSLNLFNIAEIKRDEVTLKPYLIKHIYKK